MFRSPKIKENGFISAELGIGILVVSLLAASGLITSKALQKSSSNEIMLQEHLTIVKNIEALSSINTFEEGSHNTSDMISAGVFPDHMLSSDGYIVRNRLGGEISITINTEYDDKFFMIHNSGLKTNNCINFASSNINNSDRISIDGKYVFDTNMPFDTEAAINACKGDNFKTISTEHRIN